jgi:DNA-directed RNA polymerase subunit H (RpoH/RPB5)
MFSTKMIGDLQCMFQHRGIVDIPIAHPVQITTLVVVYTDEKHRTNHLLYNTFESIKKGITSTIFRHALSRVDIPTHVTILSPTFSMPAARFLASQDDIPFTVEVIEHRVFSYDRMESMLVPEYRVMQQEEVNAWEQKLKVGREKWPCISSGDPIMKYLGIKVGSCVAFQDYHNGHSMRSVV